MIVFKIYKYYTKIVIKQQVLVYLRGGESMSKFTEINDKIEETVVDGYKKVEETVVEGYKKVEDTVVDGYQKIEDKFVDTFLKKEDETLEEAKERLKNN